MKFDGNIKFSISVLFVKFEYYIPILYRQKKDDEETEYVFKEKAQKRKKTKDGKKEEKLPFPGVKKAVVFFKDSAISLFGKAIHAFKLEKLHFKAVAASDDAAKTAELYGIMCTAGAVLHQFAENAKGIRKNAVYVEITPDFIAETADFYADLRFSIKIWKVLSLAMNGVSIWQNYKKIASSVGNENKSTETDSKESKKDSNK